MSTQAEADRNVLFGTLAVQMGFVSRDQLTAAMAECANGKSRSVGDILRAANALAEDERRLLDAIVEKHLIRHGNDVARSLAALSPNDAVRTALSEGTDRIVQADAGPGDTRGPVAAATNVDVYATRFGTTAGVPGRAASAPTRRDGRFQVIRPHARGGLGEVFVARDGELNREVALKEIQDRHADHPESRSRFVLEAEITGALEHPGIVPVYGLGTYPDGRPYYAMRFIRGESLQEAIKRFHEAERPGRDPGERALALHGLLRRFVDVCQAIAYAHSRGVIHRDLKPGNVMLGQYGETLVVDWGLAKPLGATGLPEHLPLSVEGPVQPASHGESAPTFAGTAVGTPQYMSPEQAAGRIDELGPTSDVYSLGATLYSVLVGKPPLDGVDVSEMLIFVQQGKVPPAREIKPAVPPALSAICQKAMALLPENRYPTAKAMAEDVERWLADEPTTAWPEPWHVRARRWIGRHRTGVTTVAAVVVVAGFCLGVATVLLTAANKRERDAKLEASRQRDEAAANYRLARQAVDRYHTEVSEDVLLHEPGMEPLRRRLLEAAREFYTQFAAKRSDDPEVKAELGRALYRLAQITADVDGPAQGIELHHQALAIFTELAGSAPEDPELTADRARCLHHLGRLQRETDQMAAARDSYLGALDLWERLERAHPEEEGYRAEEARTRLGIGNVEQVLRRLDRARDQYTRALAIRDALAAAHPERADYARDLATTRHNLAMVQSYIGPADQAEVNFKLALAAQEKLAAANPNVTQYQADVARTHINYGNLHDIHNRFGPARTEYQTAADAWGKLADAHPAVHRFRAGQAKAYLLLAQLLSDARQNAQAEEAVAKAQDLYHQVAAAGVLLPADRADVATGYRRAGDLHRAADRKAKARAAYQQALDLIEPLATGPDPLPEYVAELASIWNNQGLLDKVEGKKPAAQAAFRKSVQLWRDLVRAHPEIPDYADGLKKAEENLRSLGGGAGGTIAT
jgi:serine/threonine-protein kinase